MLASESAMHIVQIASCKHISVKTYILLALAHCSQLQFYKMHNYDVIVPAVWKLVTTDGPPSLRLIFKSTANSDVDSPIVIAVMRIVVTNNVCKLWLAMIVNANLKELMKS